MSLRRSSRSGSLGRRRAGFVAGARTLHTGASMKTLGLVVMLMVGVGEARAQGNGATGLEGWGPIFATGLVLDAIILGGAAITGGGSTWTVANGKVSGGWFGTSYAMATLNFGVGAAWVYLAKEGFRSTGGTGLGAFCATMAAAHLGVGLWNVIAPTLGLVWGRRDPETPPTDRIRAPALNPVFITGRAAGGGRWSGVALQVANF